MSVRVMSWVWESSAAEPTERLVLLAIADCANDAGADAYPSMATLTKKTGLHERSVQRCLKRLVEIGELVVQPGAGPRGCNRYRIKLTTGTAPPPAESRPDPGTAPPRQAATPAESRPDPGTAPPLPPAQRHPNHPLPILEPSVEPSSSPKPTEAKRPDVEEICLYLADKIVANGSRRPRITPQWRMDARLLLDADGRTVDQVKRAIDWCQSDSFWCANVLSMPKLRAKYDQLRLAAERARVRGAPKPATSDLRVRTALDLAAEFDRKAIAP